MNILQCTGKVHSVTSEGMEIHADIMVLVYKQNVT